MGGGGVDPLPQIQEKLLMEGTKNHPNFGQGVELRANYPTYSIYFFIPPLRVGLKVNNQLKLALSWPTDMIMDKYIIKDKI